MLATSAGNSSSETAIAGMRVFLVSLAVTLVAAVESWPRWPWAPFLFLHAGLGVVIPLVARCGQLGNIREAWQTHGKIIRQGILWGVAYIGLVVCATIKWLFLVGRLNDPGWNVVAAYRQIYRLVAINVGEPVTVVLLFFFVVLWAGVGEELFYRGFTYGRLRSLCGATSANLVSSVAFGLRHAGQLLYLGSPYPLVSGLIYFLFAAVAGSWLAGLYDRTGSLWPPIIVHASVNLIGFPVLLSVLWG